MGADQFVLNFKKVVFRGSMRGKPVNVSIFACVCSCLDCLAYCAGGSHDHAPIFIHMNGLSIHPFSNFGGLSLCHLSNSWEEIM